jgi:hypothetical protein
MTSAGGNPPGLNPLAVWTPPGEAVSAIPLEVSAGTAIGCAVNGLSSTGVDMFFFLLKELYKVIIKKSGFKKNQALINYTLIFKESGYAWGVGLERQAFQF